MKVEINKDNFKSEVLDSKGLVIVDFYGTWCMPCKMLAPVVEKVCNDKNIKLASVDIDENEELTNEYSIMSVPTLLIFRDGELKRTSVGCVSETLLLSILEKI